MKSRFVLFSLGLLVLGRAAAETPRDFLLRFETEARAATPVFSASAARGEKFFHAAGVGDWRCSTCHTDRPSRLGQHATTGKPIEPLAPAANPERFVRADKVDKWFRRNCKDVLDRPCTAAEKADLMAYLLAAKN